jgi:hypothetical protein
LPRRCRRHDAADDRADRSAAADLRRVTLRIPRAVEADHARPEPIALTFVLDFREA